jgi:peptide/nickel transport system substrate-binding protein
MRRVANLSGGLEKSLEENIFDRLSHFAPVRRYVFGWVLLFVLLIGGVIGQNIMLSNYYQTVKPVPGGIYREGVLGTFTNANPLYASSEADATVSRLMFASLFTYNVNGQLVGELAKDYSVDSHGTTYTVHLKPGLTWHDGKPLTSNDVVFTYHSIQNPDIQSPLQAGWQGITVEAQGANTVVFKLPSPLAPFIYNLTNGIVPEHVLADVPATDMRSSDFNTVHPVGSGPFMWRAIEVENNDPGTAQQQIALLPFDHYASGAPKLQEFVVHTFASKEQMLKSLEKQELTAAMGLTELPDKYKDASTVEHSILMRAATMTFFKTSEGVLADQKVRAALVQASDVPAIIKQLGYPTKIVREPFLNGQVAYDGKQVEASHNTKAAGDALTAAGWVPGRDGIREKAGKKLRFTLTATDTAEYRKVASMLHEQWRAVGADVKVQIQDSDEFKTSLAAHNYEAVLYGITIGVDPDVYVYWDSSQADVRSTHRLNFSEYKSAAADTALQAGRTRLDPQLRGVKYQPFLQAWKQDAPALAMYQPRLLYVTNGPVDGLTAAPISNPTDRLSNVQNWQIRQAKVTND